MKAFSVCVYLTLAGLLCVEVDGRTRIGSRTRTRPTKTPIVQIRDDKPGVQPRKTAFGDVDGQATVSTEGLEEFEHAKLKKAGKAADRVPGRYIAVMKDNAGFIQVAGMLDNVFGAAQRNGSLQISGASTFVDGFVGFTAQMNKPTLEMMLDDPDIAYMEEDQKVQGAQFFQLGNFESDVEISGQAFQYPFEQQWHNDRIDQRRLPLDDQYNPRRSGCGVDIYILDSGIRYSHNSFNGRARFGGYDYYNGDASDWHGHGTHCAGLAGGRIIGTAQRANLYSIRVLNAQLGGTFAGVIAGINHVMQRVRSTGRRTVISMSLIGGKSDAVADILKSAKMVGIVTVVTAGNFRQDACAYHPAASPDAITVGGTQEDRDQLYWFSTSQNSPGTNYGSCVDIFAPGQWVRSASHTQDNTLVSMSGASMATAIVAGAVALLLEQYPSYTPNQIANELYRMATPGVLDFSVIRGTSTVNRLLYVEPLGEHRITVEPSECTSPVDDTDDVIVVPVSVAMVVVVIIVAVVVSFTTVTIIVIKYKHLKLTTNPTQSERPQEPPSSSPSNLTVYRKKDVKRFEKIGRGSFWKVYRGKLSDSRCAIKRLRGVKKGGDHEGLVSKVLRELDMWSSLNHPNIISLYGIYHEDDINIPLLIVELMDKNLTDQLNSTFDPTHRKSLFPLKSKLSILSQVAGALDYLHCIKRVIHGDLTANNILLKENSSGSFTSKLTDFGMSRALNEQDNVMSTVQGTYSYMPPEVQNAGETTTKVDIYSFGVLCVHVLSHRFPKPLHALSVDDLGARVVMSEFSRYRPYLMELDDNEKLLEPLIEGCLQYEPEDRLHPEEVIGQVNSIEGRLSLKETGPATPSHQPSVIHQQFSGPIVSGCTISGSVMNVGSFTNRKMQSVPVADTAPLPTPLEVIPEVSFGNNIPNTSTSLTAPTEVNPA